MEIRLAYSVFKYFFIYNFISPINPEMFGFIQLYVLISYFTLFSRCNKYTVKLRMKKIGLKIGVKVKIQGVF